MSAEHARGNEKTAQKLRLDVLNETIELETETDAVSSKKKTFKRKKKEM